MAEPPEPEKKEEFAPVVKLAPWREEEGRSGGRPSATASKDEVRKGPGEDIFILALPWRLFCSLLSVMPKTQCH